MAKQFSMDDYVDVAERIQDFKDAHPRGVLRQVGWDVREVGNGTFVVYIARAYPDPITEPDVYSEGTAWEPFPGKTNFTRDSELQNAETSAWGRAIVSLGIEAKKIASRQEVVNRRADEQTPKPKPDPEWLAPLFERCKALPTKGARDSLKLKLVSLGIENPAAVKGALRQLNDEQAQDLGAWIAEQELRNVAEGS